MGECEKNLLLKILLAFTSAGDTQAGTLGAPISNTAPKAEKYMTVYFIPFL